MDREREERYSRQLMLPEIGEEGQERLLASRVLIVGAGGLASPVVMYLAAAGIGSIGIADADTVTLSNLQRQIMHFSTDLGDRKVDSASRKIQALNPQCRVESYDFYIDDVNVDKILSRYDFIVVTTDNAASRYCINDACVRLGKPFCIGGVSRFSGQVTTCVPGSSNYRTFFPTPGEKPDGPIPVLGTIVGILGTIMATEVVKYFTGAGRLLTNRLLTFDALTMEFNTIEVD